MARVFVGYVTRAGATLDVAEMLAESLKQRGIEVVVCDLAQCPSPEDYDLVVVGSGVQAGSWYPHALTWLGKNSAVLAGRAVAIFNVCLNAGDPEKRDEALSYNERAANLVETVASESFAGRYVPERVNWIRRMLMRSMSKPPTDLINPEQIAAWAANLAERIKTSQS